MPIGPFILVLQGFMVFITQAIAAYTDGPESSSLLRQLFLENRYMPTAKRTPEQPTRGITVPYECCPSITRGIAPLGGLSRDGALLQLFRDSNTIQKFYETTCAPGVHNSSCKFVDPSFSSRCVQQYTYTYAIVKDFNVTQPYRFDLMKIKSGCSCVVDMEIPEAEVVNVEKRLVNEITEEILLDI